MDMTLNSYLKKVEKYLSPLPASERADIVKEIESEMLELQANARPPRKSSRDWASRGNWQRLTWEI